MSRRFFMVKHDPKRSKNAVSTSIMLSLRDREILDQFIPDGHGIGRFIGSLASITASATWAR